MSLLKQSTAYNRMVYLGSTGLTPTVTISKNGGSFGSLAGSISEVSNNWYNLSLASGDTDTLGDLVYAYSSGVPDVESQKDLVIVDLPGGSVSVVTGNVNGNVGGSVVGSVASVTGSVGGSVASVVGGVGGQVNPTIFTATSGTLGSTSCTLPGLSGGGFAATDDQIKGWTIKILNQLRTVTAWTASTNTVTWDTALVAGVGGGGVSVYFYPFYVTTGGGGGGGDPWTTALPGSYSSGQAGYILGTSLDAAVSSRAVAGDAMILTSAYDPAKTAASPGDAMTLTSAYDPAKTAAQAGNAMTLTSGERDSVASALLDLANGVETSFTVKQCLRILASALGGKLAVSGTTITIRAVNDSADRIVATTDSSGNRSSVTLTP